MSATGGGRRRGRSARLGVTALVLALLGSACGNDWQINAKPASESRETTTTTALLALSNGEKVPVTAPGVSDTEIRVAGIASVTNPIGGEFANSFQGVKAYFDMVNAQGGIYGRKLVLKDELDDKVVNNSGEVQRVTTAGDAFAVLPVATLLFTGADELVRENVPTFGWYINNEWAGTGADPRANLFGQSGSVPCIDCALPSIPWLAKQAGKHRLGLLAYAVPQSAGCAKGTEASIDKYGKGAGLTVAFSDETLAYGISDLSVQVSKMKAAGVDVIWTCMDTNAVVTLAREAKKQGLDAIQFLPNAYDHNFLKEYGDLFEGSIVRTDFAPWEFEPRSPGMQRFLEWMGKSGAEPSENGMDGWLNADLFVAGLVAAGPNFSRQGLIDAINTKLTNYTADGLLHGVDWSRAHLDPVRCFTFSEIRDSAFHPAFTTKDSPFVCPAGKNGELVSDPTVKGRA